MEQVRIFVDTNVIIDYYTGRTGNKNAERIVQIGEDSRYRLCISVLTGINVLYVLNKFTDIIGLQTLSNQFMILPMNSEQWQNASSIRIDDPEDALQVACAIDNRCDIIVTRDKHLLSSGIDFPKILTPESLIERVAIR